tara:strand:- start:1076 stop:2266 length:1191 start_codon:yes stop_codon:yes gene_type:complete
MKINIPITKAVLGDEDKLAIGKTLDTGWIVQGPNVAKFQELFSEFTKSKYAHATTSCTTALHVGLEALGIKAGDKVIVPSFTWISSANAVEYTGAEVVFCDISLKTFNIDETKLQTIIENDKSIKGIMPVNLFGLCANMPAIMELAKKFNLKVIEDSACGFDSWIGEKHSGTFGNCGCFSFHPRKSITTGEGGMVITDDERIANKISQLKDHGADKSNFKRHNEKGGYFLPNFTVKGFNYRMTDIQGSLGVSQMNKVNYIMNGRRAVAEKYNKALSNILELQVPFVPEGYKHAYQSYTCIFTDGEDISNLNKVQIDRINIKRNSFMKKLEEMNIATRQGTHAIHTLGYYKEKNKFEDEDFLMSYAADKLSVVLPLYPSMSDEEFNYVVSNIKIALS